MNMKRVVSFILAICIFFSVLPVADAHGKDGANGHDRIMSWVLFGDKAYKSKLDKSGEEYKALVALENAVAICLDQFNGCYTDELRVLNKMNIHGIPKKIDEINFTGNQYHRRYTHRGWNFNYTGIHPSSWNEEEKGPWSDCWKLRKETLLQTVNKVFGFQTFAGTWKFLWMERVWLR